MANITWRTDPNWTTPLVVYPGGERFKLLDRHLYNKGLLCNVEGNQFVFIDVSNSWCNLASATAQVRVCAIMDITNATVNFDKSMSAYIDHLLKRCDSNVGGVIPTSVCIGTSRFEVDADSEPGTLIFEHSRTLVPHKDRTVPPVVYALCYMPISTSIVPARYTFPGLCAVLGYVAQLFPDTRDLVTVMWNVGNCLVDPSESPKSVLLYGPGGSGKSSLLRVIYQCLQGCCGTLPDGCLTSNANKMPPDVSEVITSRRMAVCFDVELWKKQLNMAVFKNISGSDYIRTQWVTCKSNCSLTIGANGTVNIDEQPEYIEDSILRRLVCVYMGVPALSIPKTKVPDAPDERLDFACACIHTRLKYDHIPIAPMSVLLTLCSSKYDAAASVIRETTKPLSAIDCEEVLSTISVIIKCPPPQVSFKASLISASCVFEISGRNYIKGLEVFGAPN